MEDNYFDKKLKQLLESPPDLQPDEAAVQDMKKRLRAAQPRSRQRYLVPLMAALLLLLPLLLGGLFVYQKYDALQSEVAELKEQMTTINQQKTTVEEQIVYRYDTIYTTIYREKYVSSKPGGGQATVSGFPPMWVYKLPERGAFVNNNSDMFSRSLGINGSSLLGDRPNSFSSFAPTLASADTTATQTNWGILNELNTWTASNLVAPPYLDRPFLADYQEELPAYKRKRISPLYYFKPKGFSVKIGGSPLLLPTNEFGKTAYAVGLAGAFEFPQNRRLEIGVEYLTTNIEAKEVEDFPAFPIVDPNDPADVLHELKGNFSYLQIPLTIRQRFFVNKKLQPEISVGLVAYRPLQQKFAYEYIDASGEYYLDDTAREGEFSVDNLRLGAGAEYFFRERFALAATVNYQHAFSLSEYEYFRNSYWGLNLGFRYIFQ